MGVRNNDNVLQSHCLGASSKKEGVGACMANSVRSGRVIVFFK